MNLNIKVDLARSKLMSAWVVGSLAGNGNVSPQVDLAEPAAGQLGGYHKQVIVLVFLTAL
jgi:hypothetical protein